MTALETRFIETPRAVVYYVGIASFLLIGMRQSYTVPYTFGFSLGQFLLLTLSLLWLLALVGGQRFRLEPRVLVVATAGYLVSSLLSYAAYNADGFRFVPSLVDQPIVGADAGLLTDIRMVLLVFVLMTVLQTPRDLEIVLKGLVLGGALSSFFALVQYATGANLAQGFRFPGLKDDARTLVEDLMRGEIIRMQGSTGHPLELGAVMTVLMPLAIGIALSCRARGLRSWPWMACAGLIAAGAVLSVSRSALLGIAVALVVLALRWPVRRAVVSLAVVAGAVVLTWSMVEGVYNAFARAFLEAENDSSVQSRAIGAKFALESISEYPWLGRGIGVSADAATWVLDNNYLSRLVDAGLFGLVSYVTVLLVALVISFQATRRVGSSYVDLFSGILASLCALVVINLILDTAGFAQIFTLTWMLVGFAAVAWRVSAASTGDGLSARSGESARTVRP
jgi:putative inorganic carbon (hco3(-)) transporter